jgi:conjugal transfer pilus assembly protein TraE
VNIKDYISSWNGSKLLNAILLAVIVIMVVSIAILSATVSNKDQTVVLRPFVDEGVMEVQKNKANAQYKKNWATSMAILIGNVTPGNIKFVEESMDSLLSPEIYSCVKVETKKQALVMGTNGVSMAFAPQLTFFEPETDRVFVVGKAKTITAAQKEPVSQQRVFEYRIEIHNYRPVIKRMMSYFGEPRTKTMLEKRKNEKAPPLSTLSTSLCNDEAVYE